MTQSARPGISPALGTVALLLALNLLNYIDRYILAGEVPPIQHEFHASDQQMGALGTAFFVFYMIAAPLTGWLGDRFRRKPMIITGAMLWSLATLAALWIHSYTTLYLRQALVGIGEATFGIFAPAVLSDFYPERERNRVLSVFYVAIPVGAALGYLAGGQIGSHWGWRAPFFVCALPGFLVAALYGWIGREPERGASDHIEANLNRNTVLGIFTNPAFLAATLGLAMLTFAMGGISWWVPEFLRRSAGMSMGTASLTVGATTVIDGIAGTLIGGWIAQIWLRKNHRALYLFLQWSVALTLPWGILLFFGPHRWAVPSLFAAEFFLFLNTGPLNTAIVNSVAAPVRATAISINLFCIHFFGDTFSPHQDGLVAKAARAPSALRNDAVFAAHGGRPGWLLRLAVWGLLATLAMLWQWREQRQFGPSPATCTIPSKSGCRPAITRQGARTHPAQGTLRPYRPGSGPISRILLHLERSPSGRRHARVAVRPLNYPEAHCAWSLMMLGFFLLAIVLAIHVTACRFGLTICSPSRPCSAFVSRCCCRQRTVNSEVVSPFWSWRLLVGGPVRTTITGRHCMGMPPLSSCFPRSCSFTG